MWEEGEEEAVTVAAVAEARGLPTLLRVTGFTRTAS